MDFANFNRKSREEKKDEPRREQHPDFEINKRDAIKLIDFWTPKLGDTPSLRLAMRLESVDLAWDAIIVGVSYLYAHVATFSQPRAEFRAGITDAFLKAKILEKKAPSRTYQKSYRELFENN